MFKKITAVILLIMASLVSNIAVSSSEHNHDFAPTNEQVIAKALRDVAVIVDNAEPIDGKPLDSSWKKITDSTIYEKSLRHYVVAVTHAKAQKTLYVLLSNEGSYLGANFSGKFAG